jgi:hypothetical protein
MSDIRAELGIRSDLSRLAARLGTRLDPAGTGEVVETFHGLGLRLLG